MNDYEAQNNFVNDDRNTKPSKRCRDPVWLGLFALNAIAFVVWSIYNFVNVLKSGNLRTFPRGIYLLFVGVILLSYIVGIALIFIFKHKPLCSLYCILVVYAASIVASFILIFVFYTRRTSFLILSAIVSLIFIVFVFLAVCRQIELTALYLKLASLIITKHIEIVYLSLFFNSILIIVTILTISSYYYFIRINKARLYVLYLILISFTSIWTYRTVFYLQFTICSEFAASIFLEKMARKKKKLADSATKILSGSLGTISLVTLIITLVEILVAVLKQLFYEVNTYLGCICGAILDFLEAIVKLLSELLLVHVAIDRNSLAKSYKATKKTMKNPNGSIITYVTTKILINACAFSGALIVFFVCKVVFERVGIADNVFYCLIAAMLYFSGSVTLLYVIHAMVLTLFLCYIEHKELVRANNVEFASKLDKLKR